MPDHGTALAMTPLADVIRRFDGASLTDLTAAVRSLYDAGDPTRWAVGNPADFLAATLYRSARRVLRLHVHAPGAADCDLHTHKGTLRSALLSGGMTHTTATPTFHHDRRTGALDVWQCGSPHGRHLTARTNLYATVDPQSVAVDEVCPGAGFTIAPGEYHQVVASPDRGIPTVSLCLFEIDDRHRREPYVLTSRPTPTVEGRTMTPGYARAALRHLLDHGLTG